MLVRTAFVAAVAALAFPLLGGSASASCLDDAQAARLDEGYSESPKSEHWENTLILDHVDHSGTATVSVYGDALASDLASWFTVDWPNYLTTHAGNAVEVTTEFADCVAG